VKSLLKIGNRQRKIQNDDNTLLSLLGQMSYKLKLHVKQELVIKITILIYRII